MMCSVISSFCPERWVMGVSWVGIIATEATESVNRKIRAIVPLHSAGHLRDVSNFSS